MAFHEVASYEVAKLGASGYIPPRQKRTVPGALLSKGDALLL